VQFAYDRGKGISMAEYGEIDDVIDPAETRRWIRILLDDRPPRRGKRRPNIDAW
jgi:acetyl-CoA carboxylase carboxyltransferase component